MRRRVAEGHQHLRLGHAVGDVDAQANLAKVQTERAASANQYVQALAALLESSGQSDAFEQYMAQADIQIPSDAP